MISFEPNQLTQRQVHAYMLGGIAPRPIALVSTISEDGILNLSPFSFYNAFGSNPPIIAFSPARRGRDNTLKDTYNNLIATKECTVNAVTEFMTHQINLASAEFIPEVNEFIKSGLTPIDSDLVKPKRVKESPFQMECKLIQMFNTSDKPGAGNIAICEIIKFHIAEEIIKDGIIHPDLIRHIGRNGADFYTKAFGNSLFSLKKPPIQPIGYDALPDFILKSRILTANNLAKLAISQTIPSSDEAIKFFDSFKSIECTENTFWIHYYNNNFDQAISSLKYLILKGHYNSLTLFELLIQLALNNDDIEKAWLLVIYYGKIYDNQL